MKISIETQDIVLAAALKILGARLESIEKNGNKGIFFFTDVEEHLIKDYDLGNLRVEPVAYNMAIKSLTTASRRII